MESAEGEEDSDEDSGSEEDASEETEPKIRVKRRLAFSWRRALIVKLLGRRISYVMFH